MQKGKPRKQNYLLTISEASQILGVSDTALRQWTDEGKVKAFVTPGGHRRYLESELRRLVSSQRHVKRLKDLVDRIESTAPMERQIAQTYLHSSPWHEKLDEPSKERLREHSRRLLGLTTQHITKPFMCDETLEAARSLGRQFGLELAQLGLSLPDALGAFILHRNLVLNAATDLMRNKEMLNKRALDAIPQVTHLMDQTLISLVEGHQDYSRRGNNDKG